MSENVQVQISGSYLIAHCQVCRMGMSVINKGLGRANVATFKTQHQHEEVSS